MNGIHDLGGMHGFGRVNPEPDEPVFHSRWEGRVLAMLLSLAAAGITNPDEFRHAIERIEPARYLASSYYERWLGAIETLMVEKGIATRDRLGSPALSSPAIVRHATAGKHSRRPRFKRGDRIVTRNLNPTGHTRLPRYARSRPGLIVRDLGAFTFPDTNAHGGGRNPQHAYSVRFSARDLWGKDADRREYVYVDLWEDYLEPAKPAARTRARRSRRR